MVGRVSDGSPDLVQKWLESDRPFVGLKSSLGELRVKLIDTVFCHCGRPLHYTDSAIKKMIERIIEEKGRYVKVTIEGEGSWLVDRHYLAMHKVKMSDLDQLGFERVA